MAFANCDSFYVAVPANVDYVIVMSGPATYVYMTNDKKASKPKKDDFYKQIAAMSDTGLFMHYAARKGTALEIVKTAVLRSFEPPPQ